MPDILPREAVLRRIRKALQTHTSAKNTHIDWEKDIYTWPDDLADDAELFARQFMAVGGKFVYCENQHEFLEHLISVCLTANWQHIYCLEPTVQALLDQYEFPYTDAADLAPAEACITSCEALVSRFGVVVVSSRQMRGRTSTVFPPVHIVVAYRSQLTPDIKTCLHLLKEKYDGTLPSMLSFTAGASRTADIEKTLVMGAHGPKELYVFLVED